MKTIKYEFNDGSISEVEINDEIYIVHEELVLEEKHNHKRETRRHISLDYLKSTGIDIAAPNSDPLAVLIQREEAVELHKALALLSDKQRELVQKVFFEELTMTEIAEAEGVDRTAVSHRFATIYKKIKKLL